MMKRFGIILAVIFVTIPIRSAAQWQFDFYELLAKDEIVTDIGYKFETGATVGVSYTEGRSLINPECDKLHTTYLYINFPISDFGLSVQPSFGFGTEDDAEFLIMYNYKNWFFETGVSITEKFIIKVEFRL